MASLFSGNGVTGNKDLQLPLLPDPSKHDDILVPSEKLEFTVRLGTSLARGLAIDERKVRKELTTKGEKLSSSEQTPVSSRRPSPSPRHFERDEVLQLPSGPDPGRKISHHTSRHFPRQESQMARKFSRKESRDGRHLNRQESRKDTSTEARRESRKESRRSSMVRQTTMLHTYITDRETVNKHTSEMQSQRTHNIAGTSLPRRCNVTTLQRRCNDVVATLCVCWECQKRTFGRTIRIAERIFDSQGCNVSSCGQRRLRSDGAYSQVDLSTHFVRRTCQTVSFLTLRVSPFFSILSYRIRPN